MIVTLYDKYACKIKAKKSILIIGENLTLPVKNASDMIISSGIDNINNTDDTFIITSPGEYEVKGISVQGEKSFFLIELDDLRVCYLFDPQYDFTENQLEDMGVVDAVLLILAHGQTDYAKVKKNIDQIQPNFLIIVGMQEAQDFLSQAELQKSTAVGKIEIIKANLPEEMEVIVLQ